MNSGSHQPMDNAIETSSVPQHPPPHCHEKQLVMPPATALDMFPATLYRDTRFIRYNMFGNIVEVTPKYKPPIMRLGQGAYGVVYSAVNSETNEKVAIKKIADTFYNRIDAKRTLREIKLLRHMNHDNIVAIKDIIPPSRRNSFNDVYIVYEFMETDLHEVITSMALSSKHHQYFLYQILRGLKYIHSGNVLHRDLKPSNLLLNLNCDLKIGDFGLARLSSESNAMTECVVTRWYRAPELLLNPSSYGSAIDMWSVGCIFMEMMLRKPLFHGRNHSEQLRLIIQLLGTPTEAEMESLNNQDATRYLCQLPFYPRRPLAFYFPNIDPLAIDLVEKLLTFDPRCRITVEEALAHPYLESLHDASDEPVCEAQFDYGFVSDTLTEAQAKEIIHMEAMAFNPQYYEPYY